MVFECGMVASSYRYSLGFVVLSGDLLRMVSDFGMEASSSHCGHSLGLVDAVTSFFSALVVESSSCWLESP